MSGLEVLAVVACVAGGIHDDIPLGKTKLTSVLVVSAYHDGTGLIGRIKDKRAKRKALEEGKTQALEGSLELGPLIVQGQYDQDYRRWGERYAQGDQIARESLKDIIIQLQSSLLTNLQHAWADDVEIDFRTLQVVSDESRVRAVLTLCQLYQRLSIEGPLAPALASPMSSIPQPMGRVTTMSTIGSVSPNPTPPRLSYVSSTSTSSFPQPTTPDASVSMDNTFARLNINQEQASPHPERKSSGGSTGFRSVFKRGPKHATEVSTTTLTPHTHYPPHLQQQAHETVSVKSSDWLLTGTDPQEAFADQMSIASSDYTSTADSSICWGPDDVTTAWALERPISSEKSQTTSHHQVPTSTLEVVQPSPTPIPVQRVPSNPLYLPCEENKFAGFCKGSWKLQIGMKKAMTAEYRPSGIYGQTSYWRCQKCYFEGPMMGKDKASRSFDDRIRESNGIRYRWVFLAKSHTFTRSVGRCVDGSFGTYGCIFCCAELSKVPPMFGNVKSLMDHLQAHRDRPPTGELLYRTKCIVGRVAGPEEDFDINLPSRVQEVPA